MKKVKTVCIIDDDEIAIFCLKKSMKQIAYCDNLVIFNDGITALKHFKRLAKNKEKSPSIIFLDINMPEMSGWHFLKELIKIPGNEAGKDGIYVMSSSLDIADISKVHNNSLATRFLPKPVNSTLLLDIL
ncbi:response regulator [uncultured Kriegella sp.]|uniref:response regulator n=1 Tax=uncultured Kriegella sp. TaxID=1798910 RepID=UPI0030DC060A|tara:strand:- start:282555 stop:282944 length:390 start_codon:yes stop_codon:yes gene_type:complete